MENHIRKRKLTSTDDRLRDSYDSESTHEVYVSKGDLSDENFPKDVFSADGNQLSFDELVNGLEPRPGSNFSSTDRLSPLQSEPSPKSESNHFIFKERSVDGLAIESIGSEEGISYQGDEHGEKLRFVNARASDDPPELNFREVPETPTSRRKVHEIEEVLSQHPIDVKKLKTLAISEGGLINDNIRKRAWAKLVGIDKIPPLDPLSDAELAANGEYSQVVLDVNRSLKRFPPGIPYDQRVVLQDQLTRLIMRVIIKYPHLRYYQGYHDVAVTILLVVGEEAAFPIMEKLSTGYFNECMAETMDSTSHLLNYIYPLMKRMHSKVHDFMERSGCGTLFCLPWYLTWFGHNLNHYTDVVRLYDYFMSCDKLLPLYLSAAIVVYRKDEIFNVECDMPYVHSLLSDIPDDLPFEKLLQEASQLYKKYPPSSIESEVNERTRLSRMLMRAVDDKAVRRRPPLRNILQLMPRYSIIFATATLVVGLYAYIRTASALDPDVLFPFR